MTPLRLPPARVVVRPPSEAPALPSLPRRALHLAGAAGRAGLRLAGGGPLWRGEEEARRILETHCRPCEFFRDDVCLRCGCGLMRAGVFAGKLRLRTEHCPEKKW